MFHFVQVSYDFPASIGNMQNQSKQVLKFAQKYDEHAFLLIDKLVFKGTEYLGVL